MPYLTSKTSISGLLLAGLALVAAPNAMAQNVEQTPPSLIQQNIGPVSSSDTIAQSVDNIYTLTYVETMASKSGLSETLETGEYTVFTPRDSSFWQGSNAEFTELMNDETYAKNVLLSHVIAGDISASALIEEIQNSPTGTVTKSSVSGIPIDFSIQGEYVQLTDEFGNVAEVTRSDLEQANGRIHIINSVLGPQSPNAIKDIS